MLKIRLILAVFLLFAALPTCYAETPQRFITADLFSLASYTKEETMISVGSGTYSDRKNGIYETVQSYLKPTNIYFPSQCFDTALKAFRQTPQDAKKRVTLFFNLNDIAKENDHLQLASETDAPEGSTRGSFLRIDSCKQLSLGPSEKFSSAR